MTRFVSLSMLAIMVALSIPMAGAQAMDRDRDHERCTWVRKCHWDDGRKVCRRERVCEERREERHEERRDERREDRR